MEGNIWSLEQVLKDHPADPNQPVWAFLFHGEHVTLNVVQLQDPAGLRPHIHKDHDEVIYIVQGRGRFRIGDRVQEVGPGAIVAAPKGVPHGPLLDGPGVLLSLYGPPFDPANPDRVFVE